MVKEKVKNTNLAKVLWYYNLIPDIKSTTQKIICPFHEDVNPSMVVNLDEDSWHCFGCNKSGDSVKFVKLLENQIGNKLNDLSTYKKYSQILKSKKCSDIQYKKFTKKRKAPDKELYDRAYDYYYCLPKVNWKLENDLIKSEKDYLIKRGFSTEVLNETKAKININESYPIIFPMFDNNEFKGWVCRTTNKDIEKKRKYLYNEGFKRATTLVGNYGKKDYVILVEGYMDRLKFLQYGEKNVVAILGWKITDEQIDKLKKQGIKYIISALDNDKYGKLGTTYLKKYFNVTSFKYLKNIKDVGDASKIQFDKMHKKTIENFNLERRGKQRGRFSS